MKTDRKLNNATKIAQEQGLNLQAVKAYYDALPVSVRKKLTGKEVVAMYVTYRISSPAYGQAAKKFLSVVTGLETKVVQRVSAMAVVFRGWF